jgi:hypothetical protein
MRGSIAMAAASSSSSVCEYLSIANRISECHSILSLMGQESFIEPLNAPTPTRRGPWVAIGCRLLPFLEFYLRWPGRFAKMRRSWQPFRTIRLGNIVALICREKIEFAKCGRLLTIRSHFSPSCGDTTNVREESDDCYVGYFDYRYGPLRLFSIVGSSTIRQITA